MFADNERISEQQVQGQFLLTYLGPVLLWAFSGTYHLGNLVGIFLGVLFLMVWFFYMIRCAHGYRYPEKYWGKWMGRFILSVFFLYLVFTGAWISRQAGEILSDYMISGVSPVFLMLLFLLISLGACGELQARGRFAQTVWPIIRTVTIVFLVIAILYGNQTDLTEFLPANAAYGKESMKDLFTYGRMKEEGKEMFRQGIRIAALFAGITFLPLLNGQVIHQGQTGRKMFRQLGKAGVFLAILWLLCFLEFGEKGGENLKYPILDLMAGVKFPGGFVRRMDLIFLTFLLFSLIFAMGSILFYGKHIMECMKIKGSRGVTGILCFLVAMAAPGGRLLTEGYPEILIKIFLPFFVLLTFCNSFLKKGRKEKIVSLFLCFLLTVSGCQMVEPEKRAYPLVAGIDWQEGEYQIILSMAQLAESTGQGKTGGEGQAEDQSGVVLKGSNKEEILKAYHRQEQLYLDPGHIQAVVFGKNIMGVPGRLEETLLCMEKDHSLGNSLSVFAAEDLNQVFDRKSSKEESLGKFLTGIYENRISGKKPVTLSQVYRKLHNEKRIRALPKLLVEENGIVVDKTP